MTMKSQGESGLTFGLVHGAWHGGWCWEYLQEELEAAGHKTVAVDLPIDNPAANFDDYADTVVDALDDASDVVLVGHSRGGNVIPRVAGRVSVRKLIYVCASFEVPTIGRPTAEEFADVPTRFLLLSQMGVKQLDNDMTVYDKQIAKNVFYHDCPPKIANWAASLLRPQRRSSNEPKLKRWPDVPQEYILCKKDRVINPAWSRYAAKNWLGITPIEIGGGHSPFLSRAHELGQLILNLSE